MIQQLTTYLDENNKEATSDKIDLSDANIKKIVNIGFYQNEKGEIQAVKMPKTIEKLPNKKLPAEITSTKDMFAGALVFNRDLSKWNVAKVIKHEGFATNSNITNNIINYLPKFQS